MFPIDEEHLEAVRKLMEPFDMNIEAYTRVRDLMSRAMELGLDPNQRQKAAVKMYPSFVTKMPNGTETGQYLALDLGGTNYRVILVTLSNKEPPRIEERTYAIPKDKMLGTGEELFDYIAQTLHNFLDSHGLAETVFSLGFTFSFPCEQHSLSESILVRWTKGFAALNVEGRNVAKLLQDAIDRTGVKVKCVAVINDTVGTLASCALLDQRCAIGLIVGTGTNAAYLEPIVNVPLLFQKDMSNGDIDLSSDKEVVINMEWGAFGDNGELDIFRSNFDKTVDAASLHPGKQLFEKMCSGMYLGELVRHICVHLIEKKLLFQGEMPERFKVKDAFHTKYITETERDPPHLFYSTHYMLTEDLEVPIVEPVDDRIVRFVCEKVSVRAAYLIGAGLAAILHRMKRKEVTIGIDGSLYRFHPKFRERMTDIIDKLKPESTKFRLRISEDGSGKGAAAIAAAQMRGN